MKNITLSILITFALVLTQCNVMDELTEFDIDYTYEYELPASPGLDVPIDLYTPGLETNSEDYFALHDTRKDLVEEIYIKEVKLRVTSPPDGSFDFLKHVKIYIKAMHMEETLIAWKEDIKNANGRELRFNTTSEDLQEYLKQDKIVLRFNTLTDEAIEEDMKIEIYSVFHVNARVLGI